MNIQELNPQILWKNFYRLTQIPRPSKHEASAVSFVKTFGESLGLVTETDQVGNVLIRKNATAGKEDFPGVILQAHLDMVPQKNRDKNHDFRTDPIETRIEDDWVTANGTTLGADNGIGVAAMLSVLESDDIKHGPIEALFTIDEETGMTGAFALKKEWLKGSILINLDSEEEGELYVGCAGGVDASAEWKCDSIQVPEGFQGIEIFLKGLKGGHSGLDINLGRANANKILTRILLSLNKDFEIYLNSFRGGDLRNAIPREANCIIFAPEKSITSLQNKIQSLFTIIKSEYSETEPGLDLTISEDLKTDALAVNPKQAVRILNAVNACPNGVIRMSDTMEGVVETSLNLAIVNINPAKAEAHSLLRSSVDSAKEHLTDVLNSLFTLANANISFHGDYPGWRPNPDSHALKKMIEVSERLYRRAPAVKAIHAGLECGILGSKYPSWDMISCGPTIRYPHSPDEKVHIGSVENFWNYLKATLEEIK